MANQYVNKVIVNNEIKMDLTEDTITPNTLRKGFTAHDASGAPIVGNESLTDISEDGTNAGPILELSAEGWAEQTQLSGKNLLPNTVSGTQTINGVTFTVNPDKSITCTGTATADALFDLATPNTILGELSANASYCCYGVPKGYDDNCRLYIRTTTNINNLTGGSSSILQNGLANVMMVSDIEYINRVYIKITSGTTVDIVISPQLELGTMPTSYEPYCGGMPSPNPEYPQEIKVARGRNLLNPSLLNSTYYSANADGSVMVVDTDSRIWSSIQEIPLSAGSYVLSRRVGYGRMALRTSDDGYASETVVAQGVNTIAFTLASDGGIKLKSGYSYSSVTVTYPFTEYIQLEKGSVATPYIPYGHVGMEVQGRNMLPNKTTSQTINGITFTPNADGSVTVNGTSTAVATYYFMGMGLNDILKHGETYTISGSSDHAFVRVWSRTLATKQDTSFVWDANVDNCNCVCTVNSGVTISNEIVYPQLEAGSEATEYEPYYHSTIPIPLPSKGFAAALPDDTSDILSLNGAGGYEWTNSTNEKVLDSSVGPWNVHSSIASWFYKDYLISDMDYAKGDDIGNGTSLSSSYIQWSYNTVGDIPNGYFAFGHVATDNNVLRFVFKNTDFTVKEDFTSWIAQNPVTVLYPLATPTIEQGYVNEWNNDFPLGCTIDIPELRNINVEYFLYDSITQLADDYYDRTTNDISEAMSQTADSATLEALAAIAPIENDISSANYAVGSYLINDGKLYQVTQAIAANEAITVGTNVVLTDVGSELDELNDAVDEINANPYILPTMSESEKGGAKIGEGLSVSNDILNVDMLGNDPNDAGPLLSLQAEGWAEQTQLSGKNLLPHHMSTPTTVNGITYVENADRSITFDGTASNQSRYYFANKAHDGSTTIANLLKSDTLTASIDTPMPTGTRLEFAFYKDTTWTGKVVSISGSNSTLTITAPDVDFNKVTVYILVENSIVVSNTTIHPQLELGTQATSYEPYCGGIPSPNPDYPQEIKVAKGRNLLPNTYSTTTNNGVTFTVNADWSVTANGTVSGNYATIVLLNTAGMQDLPIIGQTATLTLSGCPSGGGSSTYQIVADFSDGSAGISIKDSGLGITYTYANLQRQSAGNIYIRIYGNGRTVSNLTFKPQLELGSTAHPYVPYGYLGMDMQGRNLVNIRASAFTKTTYSTNEVTWTFDGSDLSVSGTASGGNSYPEMIGSSWTSMYRGDILPAGTYVASCYPSTMMVRVGKGSGNDTTYIIQDVGSVSFTISEDTMITVGVFVKSGSTANGKVQVQLERGSTVHPYELYWHQTVPIPLPSKGFVAALPDGTSDILKLDGAGKFEWVNNTNEVVLDGNEIRWNKEYSYYYTPIANRVGNGNVSIVCDKYIQTYDINTHASTLYTLYAHNNVNVSFNYDNGEMGFEAFKSVLASNPVTVLYPLANPTTEQGYLDNWDNDIPLHATIDIPELRNIGVECYMDEQAPTLNAQWSERLRSEMDSSSTNAITESLASLAPVENDISSANYSVGSYLIHNNQLYKVTTAIATGEAISTNTNITPATIANELLDIDSDLLDFSELLEAAKAEYREKFQAIDSWQAAASQLIREDNGYYSNESITRMLAQRFDGKLYGYSEPKTTAVAITKTGANASLANPTLGTATVAGSSAYRHLGPFQWFAAKGIVDSDGVPHVSTIKGIDSDADWNADTNNVWSLRPIQWYSIDSTGGTVIGSLSDTWHLGLKPNPQAYLPDGTLRPYMLAPRYALGFENGVGVSKSGFKGYGRDVSHNSLITKLDYANTGYSGKTIYENWYDIFVSRMIYGTKDFQTIMQGCTAYNYQYHPSVAEQDTTRVILSNANAANLVVGSTMMMGNQATVSTDRNNVNAYNIFDGLIIESITEYDADNKSIELATDTTFNTDPAYLFSTAPWHSGSCDTMDWDGSPTNPLSAKECAFFQGCELMTGVYEILANIILKGEANARQIPYIVYSSRDDATSVTANFVKCGDGLLSNDGTAGAWKYPLYIADHNGLLYGEEAGGSTTAGCADGQYIRPDLDATDSEWRSVGYLWIGRSAGLSCVYAGAGLGYAYWSIWSRLSPVGLSRG